MDTDKSLKEELWEKYCLIGTAENPTDTMYYEGFCEALKAYSKEIGQYYLGYCKEQNGMDYCKNCGLSEESLYSVLK